MKYSISYVDVYDYENVFKNINDFTVEADSYEEAQEKANQKIEKIMISRILELDYDYFCLEEREGS